MIMKTTGIFLPSLCALSLTVSTAFSAGENWMTDFEAAKETAAKENKALLVDFTGSDWCGWCIRLVKEVFSHDEFKTGVEDGFVLVEIDYPRDKTGMTAETIAQNEELKEKYSIKGYPTILLMDAKGRPFAKTGYREGGPEKYVENLEQLLQIREKRNEAFAKAEKLEGVDKAEALLAGLKALPIDDALVASFYGEKVEQIKQADPEDETGFVKNIETGKKYAEFEAQLNSFAGKKDFEGALELIDKTLADGDFEGEMKQQIMMIKGIILAESGEYDKSLTALDEAKAVDPETELAGRLDMLKERITQLKEKKAAEGEDTEG